MLAATAVYAVGIDVLTIELGGHARDGGGEFLDLLLYHLFVVWTLAAVSVALLAVLVLASCWMYSRISSP